MNRSLQEKLQPILSDFQAFEKVAGVQHGHIPALLTKVLAPNGIVFLHINYAAENAISHKSLAALENQLRTLCMVDSADLISQQVPYLLFDDLSKALSVYHEIQKDSTAISVTIHYAGYVGTAAEDAIKTVHKHALRHSDVALRSAEVVCEEWFVRD